MSLFVYTTTGMDTSLLLLEVYLQLISTSPGRVPVAPKNIGKD